MMLPFGNLHTSRDIRGWNMSGFTVRGCKALTDDITTVFTVNVKSAVDKYFCFASLICIFSQWPEEKHAPLLPLLLCVWHFQMILFFFFSGFVRRDLSAPLSHFWLPFQFSNLQEGNEMLSDLLLIRSAQLKMTNGKGLNQAGLGRRRSKKKKIWKNKNFQEVFKLF